MLDERLAAGDGRQAERDGRQAERDGRQADVVGHSYGGFLALQLALARPDLVRRVAVYDPVAFNVLTADERAAGFVGVKGTYELPVDEAWLAAFVDWWSGPGERTKLPEPTRAAFRQVGWKMSQEVATLMADRESDYARVRAPVLVLGGGRSPEAERMTVARLARVVPGAELHMFDDLGHMGPIVDAERVNAAIALTLRRCSSRARRVTAGTTSAGMRSDSGCGAG